MRMTVGMAIACLMGGIAVADDVQASIKRFTNIPAQSLGTALQTLAAEREVQLVYFSKAVDALNTPGAIGELTTDEALSKLLSGTGLSYRYLDDKTITITPAAGRGEQRAEGASTTRTTEAERGEEKPAFWDRFRLAQVDSAQVVTDSSDTASDRSDASSPAKLDEIVVTAQKRLERLQDVPVPVSVISAETLVNNNLLRVQDYYNRVPGLNFSAGNRGELFLSIRGLVTGSYGNPTVGVVVDDVPYGSTTTYMSAPDLDPNELSSVEVSASRSPSSSPQNLIAGRSASERCERSARKE